MKVLLFNGSPHEKGSTYACLEKIAAELQKENIETEIIHVGRVNIDGYADSPVDETPLDEIVKTSVEKAKTADGFIFGSPVYFASPTGSLLSFMDKFFVAAKPYVAFKPGASISVARRAGTTCTYDVLNKYIGISRMLMVPSNYWNMAYGKTAEMAKNDEEGMTIMSNIGKNMAWLLKVLDNAKKNNITPPSL